MAKLVQYVLHKETKEKRLIKVSRFNPDLHKLLDGHESDPFASKAGANSTPGGIVVTTGTKVKATPAGPTPEEVAAKEAEEKKAADAKEAKEKEEKEKADEPVEPEAGTPEARFAELKAIGWVKLSKEEKVEYKELKAELA